MRRIEVEAGEGRLDAVLAAAAGLPRADVQRAIAAGTVLVDGEPRPKSYRLRGGERIVAEIPGRAEIEAEPGGVPVRYEDEHLMVVAKPAGMVTHPTVSRREGTLVNRLLGMGVPLSAGSDPERPGIVHRLDAGTSGLLVVAKTDEAHAALRGLFSRHEVERTYQALVRGAVEHDDFAVDAPLEKHGARVRVRQGTGMPAETVFSVLERHGERSTLLRAMPRTGRTHQIRVHARSIGHAILGDRAYGGGGEDAERLGLERMFLHSWEVRLEHPLTGERVEVTEPLPEDLAEALRRARA